MIAPTLFVWLTAVTVPTGAPDPNTDPSPFDWLANVVVPGVLGLATVLVAIGAWRTAGASNKLVRQIAARDEQEAALARRAAIAADLRSWIQAGWDPTATSNERRGRSYHDAVFVGMFANDEDPDHFRDIYRRLNSLDELIKRARSEAATDEQKAKIPALCGVLAASAHVMIQLWCNDPQTFSDGSHRKLYDDQIKFALEALAREPGSDFLAVYADLHEQQQARAAAASNDGPMPGPPGP